MSKFIIGHDTEMRLREKLAERISLTLEQWRGQQHVTSVKIQWPESLVTSLAADVSTQCIEQLVEPVCELLDRGDPPTEELVDALGLVS